MLVQLSVDCSRCITIYRDVPTVKRSTLFQGPLVVLALPCSRLLILTVAGIEEDYGDWLAKGAAFLTAPMDLGSEILCYLRDRDGRLVEVGLSTGLLTGHLAAKSQKDLLG